MRVYGQKIDNLFLLKNYYIRGLDVILCVRYSFFLMGDYISNIC